MVKHTENIDVSQFETFCSKLALFNKIYVKRNGKGLLNVIELEGISRQKVLEIVKMEADFFYANRITDTQKVVNENDVSKAKRSVVFVDNPKADLKIYPDSIYFFESGKAPVSTKNVFDVSTYFSLKNYNALKEGLDFEDFTLEKYRLCKIDESITELLKYVEMSYIINQTILYHYETQDNDTFSMSDFNWIQKDLEKYTSDSIVTAENSSVAENQKVDSVTDMMSTILTDNLTDNNSSDKDNNVSMETSESNTSELSETLTEAVEEVPDTETVEIKETENIPKPDNNSKKDFKKIIVKGIKKENLTEEERNRNDELLHNIFHEHEQILEYIEELKNSKWRILINRMRVCLNNKTFDTQWCPLYLEISNDISSPLYAKLYELDQKTRNYHNELIHQVQLLGCPNCGKEWEEDITFMSFGFHFVECPYCYTSRPISKDK